MIFFCRQASFLHDVVISAGRAALFLPADCPRGRSLRPDTACADNVVVLSLSRPRLERDGVPSPEPPCYCCQGTCRLPADDAGQTAEGVRSRLVAKDDSGRIKARNVLEDPPLASFLVRLHARRSLPTSHPKFPSISLSLSLPIILIFLSSCSSASFLGHHTTHKPDSVSRRLAYVTQNI